MITNDALIDGAYRYWLSRGWQARDKWVNYICLNPSTADATKDDPTIRRLTKFTERLGYNGFIVTNLFAFRATDPKNLPLKGSVGVHNDVYLVETARKAHLVVLAWGNLAPRARAVEVVVLLQPFVSILWCFGVAANGQPRHPLYLPKDTPLEPWKLWRLKP